MPLLAPKKQYFCDEPWTGVVNVTIEGDVVLCPCYLKMKIGNLNESSLSEIWNSPAIISLRKSFAKGKLPRPCRSQVCPVAVGAENHKMG